MNAVIENTNNFSLPELNSVWANVLHKGHGKPRDIDRSYRTISTCPLLSKCLDKYIGSLYESGWASAQAESQFQGPGSSHDLAAILLTEAIQYSIHVTKKPLFVLMLDAKSAFDKIRKESIIRNAYCAGSRGQGLVYLAERLGNRRTFVEWDKVLMGPICDKIGVEQGGCLSDRLYKLANNEQHSVAQASSLGLQMDEICLSSIGLADDTCLLSSCIFNLQNLVVLTEEYCKKYVVELVPEKTKLLCFSPAGQDIAAYYWQLVSPVNLSDTKISFVDEADHVGVTRSIHGNKAHILRRISAHNRAIMAILPAGLARSHKGNPAASLHIERLYGTPVLLSGMASLVLKKSEIKTLQHHFKMYLERIQKLYKSSPDVFVYFLAGSLPIIALLHLRQLTLLGMIARLGPSNILFRHGMNVCSSSSNRHSNSWFMKIKHVCSQYGLPTPYQLMTNPPPQGC